MEEEIYEEQAAPVSENKEEAEKDMRLDGLEKKLEELEAENKTLRECVEALKTLPHFFRTD